MTLQVGNGKTQQRNESQVNYAAKAYVLSFSEAGPHSYLDTASDTDHPILRGTNRVTSIHYTTDAVAREAVSFIERHKDGPWFVYLPFNAVHAPLRSLDKYLTRFPNIADTKRRTFAAGWK